MPKLLKRCVLLALAMCASNHVWAKAQSYTYVDLAAKDEQIAIDPSEREVVLGHRGSSAKFCDSKSKFHCFSSQEIAFSIPRRFDLHKGNAEWTYGGHSFVAHKVEEEITLLGQRLTIIRIESPTQRPPLEFWYNPNRGLVGIREAGVKTDHLFLLREKCGFGAISPCP